MTDTVQCYGAYIVQKAHIEEFNVTLFTIAHLLTLHCRVHRLLCRKTAQESKAECNVAYASVRRAHLVRPDEMLHTIAHIYTFA